MNNPILEIVSHPRTTVQTVVRDLRTADRLGGPVQSRIGPVRPVRDFQTGPRQHYFRHGRIWVIADKPGMAGYFSKLLSIRGLLATTGVYQTTILSSSRFVNDTSVSFFPSDSLLDVCGRLEGENIVHVSISGPSDRLWYLEEASVVANISAACHRRPVVWQSLSSTSNTAIPSTKPFCIR
jgi:hypothetical protein